MDRSDCEPKILIELLTRFVMTDSLIDSTVAASSFRLLPWFDWFRVGTNHSIASLTTNALASLTDTTEPIRGTAHESVWCRVAMNKCLHFIQSLINGFWSVITFI